MCGACVCVCVCVWGGGGVCVCVGVRTQSCMCVFYHALDTNVGYVFYASFVCLYIADLYIVWELCQRDSAIYHYTFHPADTVKLSA